MRAQVKELKWGDSTIDVSMGATITEEEQRVIQERMKELDLVLRNEKKPATYKLEVLFNNERSVHKAFGGLVTWWHSGNKLHGGGELIEIPAARILKLKSKPTRSAEPSNRRRIERQNERLGNLGKFSVGRADNRFHMVLRSRALVPMFQRHEHRGGIRPPRIEDEVLTGQGIG